MPRERGLCIYSVFLESSNDPERSPVPRERGRGINSVFLESSYDPEREGGLSKMAEPLPDPDPGLSMGF